MKDFQIFYLHLFCIYLHGLLWKLFLFPKNTENNGLVAPGVGLRIPMRTRESKGARTQGGMGEWGLLGP